MEHGRELGPGADRLKPGKTDLRRQKSLKGTGRPRQQRVQKGKGQGQGWKGHPDLDEAGGHEGERGRERHKKREEIN